MRPSNTHEGWEADVTVVTGIVRTLVMVVLLALTVLAGAAIGIVAKADEWKGTVPDGVCHSRDELIDLLARLTPPRLAHFVIAYDLHAEEAQPLIALWMKLTQMNPAAGAVDVTHAARVVVLHSQLGGGNVFGASYVMFFDEHNCVIEWGFTSTDKIDAAVGKSL